MQASWIQWVVDVVDFKVRKATSALLTAALSLSFVGGNTPLGTAGELKLYWSVIQDNVIRRSNADGTQPENVVETPGGVVPDIAFDPTEQKMYWPSPVVGGIQRGDYGGSDAETVIDGLDVPTHVSIDATNRKAYWIDFGSPSTIWRSNLDGSDRELLVTSLPTPTAVEIDPVHGYYYWSEQLNGTIHRTSLADNSQTSIIFDESAFGRAALLKGLAIDPINGYLYATDFAFHSIIRMRLDGSDPTLWVTKDVFFPQAIVLDATNERVIWSNENLAGGLANSANISSVRYDGQDQRIDFVPRWNPFAAGFVRHLALVEIPVPEPNGIVLANIGTMVLTYHSRIARRAANSTKAANA